jgi:hypothetical protein
MGFVGSTVLVSSPRGHGVPTGRQAREGLLVIADLDPGVKGNHGEIKLGEPFVLFGDDDQVLPDVADESGGGDPASMGLGAAAHTC